MRPRSLQPFLLSFGNWRDRHNFNCESRYEQFSREKPPAQGALTNNRAGAILLTMAKEGFSHEQENADSSP